MGQASLRKSVFVACAILGLCTLAAGAHAQPTLPSWAQGFPTGDGWVLVHVEEGQVAFMRPARPPQDGVVEERIELREIDRTGDFPYRSMSATVRVDCAARRLSPMRITEWRQNNLSGEQSGSEYPSPPWLNPPPNTLASELVDWSCDPANGVVSGAPPAAK